MPLSIRFWNSSAICVGSAMISGRSRAMTSADAASKFSCRCSQTPSTTFCKLTLFGASAVRLTRENASRSTISRCRRLVPASMKPRNSRLSASSLPSLRRVSSCEKPAMVRNGACKSCEATYANCSRSLFERTSAAACSRSRSSVAWRCAIWRSSSRFRANSSRLFCSSKSSACLRALRWRASSRFKTSSSGPVMPIMPVGGSA